MLKLRGTINNTVISGDMHLRLSKSSREDSSEKANVIAAAKLYALIRLVHKKDAGKISSSKTNKVLTLIQIRTLANAVGDILIGLETFTPVFKKNGLMFRTRNKLLEVIKKIH